MARAYRDLTDDELERLIGGLPRREPGLDLRRRILSVRPVPARRRSGPFRPALALAALSLLILADGLVLGLQNAHLQIAGAGAVGTRVAPTASESDEVPAWLGDDALSSGPLHIALLRADRESPADTYGALLRALCEGADGG